MKNIRIVPSSRRVGIIDCFRFVFIILIVCHHSIFFGCTTFLGAYIGVEFFYIVSGWLFARTCYTKKRTDFFVFLCHKVKGFYLEFLLATTTGFILMSIFDKEIHDHWLTSFVYWIGDIFLLQIWGFPVLSATGVSWFLSALIGSLCILGPIGLMYPRTLSFAAASVILSIYGFLCVNYGSLSPILQPIAGGIVHAGLLRAVADMLVGYLSYSFSTKLSLSSLNRKERNIMEILEWGGYLTSLYLIFRMNGPTRIDFLIVLLLFISVTISFSQMTKTSYINGVICDKIGKYSLNIYLSHGCIGLIFGKIKMVDSYGTTKTFLLYIIFTIILVFLNNRMSYFIRKYIASSK